MKIYFAHPIRTYHTKEEKAIIDSVKTRFPNCVIINPADVMVGVAHRSCKQCMREIMRPLFFKLVARCEKFLLWDATGSCGVRCELHEAWRLGKDVIQVESVANLRNIELQSYHYAHQAGQKEKDG